MGGYGTPLTLTSSHKLRKVYKIREMMLTAATLCRPRVNCRSYAVMLWWLTPKLLCRPKGFSPRCTHTESDAPAILSTERYGMFMHEQQFPPESYDQLVER